MRWVPSLKVDNLCTVIICCMVLATGHLQQGICSCRQCYVYSMQHETQMQHVKHCPTGQHLVLSNSRPLLHDDFQRVSLIMEHAGPIQLVNCPGETLRSLLVQCHTSKISTTHCHNSDCTQDPSRIQLSCSGEDFDQPVSSSALHRLTTSCVCYVQGMPDSHRSPDGLLSLKFPHAFRHTSAALSRISITCAIWRIAMTEDYVCHMRNCHNCRSCVVYALLQ